MQCVVLRAAGLQSALLASVDGESDRSLSADLGVECYVKTALVRVGDTSEVDDGSLPCGASGVSLAAMSASRTSAWSRTAVSRRSFCPEFHEAAALRGDGTMVALQVWHRPPPSTEKRAEDVSAASSRGTDGRLIGPTASAPPQDILLALCLIPLPLRLSTEPAVEHRGWFPLFAPDTKSDSKGTPPDGSTAVSPGVAVGAIEVEISHIVAAASCRTVQEEMLGLTLLAGPATPVQILLGELTLPPDFAVGIGFPCAAVSLRYVRTAVLDYLVSLVWGCGVYCAFSWSRLRVTMLLLSNQV